MNILLLALNFILFSVSLAHAGDYTHGDACATAGAFHQTNDANGVDFLVCNGSNWVTVVNFDQAGNLLKMDNDPAAGSQGCIRYTEGTGLEYSDDCSTFTALNAIGSSLWTDNTEQITRGDFHILDTGETMTSAGFDGVGDVYMMYHTDKGALRVGNSDVWGAWNEANIGTNSLAMGIGTIASGDGSFAGGKYSYARADHSFAFGNGVSANNARSVAFGISVDNDGWNSFAFGSGLDINANAANVFALSTSDGATDDPEMGGSSDGSVVFFMGTQEAVVMNTPDTFALFGGNMVIDPNDPATQLTARVALDVGAATDAILIPTGTVAQRPTAVNGMIRYNSDNNELEGYENSAWVSLGANGGSGASDIDGLTDAFTDYATDHNIIMGRTSAAALTSGAQYNTFIGESAGATSGNSTATTDANTALGYQTLNALTTGKNNIAIGYQAGDLNTTGDDNILIGYDVDAPLATTSDYLNIGNLIYGDLANGYIGIGDTAPSVALDVVGDIDYTGVITDVSDERLKDNIKVIDNALDKIIEIKGVSFTMKDDVTKKIELGLIAQDVEKVFPNLVIEKSDGMKTLNYIGMIGPIVEAIKELKAENEDLKRRIQKLGDQ